MPAHRALLWELPRSLASRAYNRLAAMAYAFVDNYRLTDVRTKRGLERLTAEEGLYFYVIVVPSVLHFLIPAIRLIRDHVRVVFVLNGVAALERKILERAFPDIPLLEVWTLPGAPWPHGHLLSLLLRVSERDFGVCDHDFFLFEPSVLEQLGFGGQEFAICVTSWRNKVTGIDFPGTHFLYVQTASIRQVMARYGVGAQLYRRTPRNVRPILDGMGLSCEHPPKEYQSFFDSFLMISALAIHDGLKVRRATVSPRDWTHVGGTSIGVQITKSPVHHYASCRFLARLADPAVLELYKRRGLVSPDQASTVRRAVDSETAQRIDKLIDRLSAGG
jgi:hypothetical protein